MERKEKWRREEGLREGEVEGTKWRRERQDCRRNKFEWRKKERNCGQLRWRGRKWKARRKVWNKVERRKEKREKKKGNHMVVREVP